MSNPVTTLGDDASSLAASVANSTEHAIRNTQRAAQQGIDQLANNLDGARSQTSNALHHLVSDTEALAHRGMDAVRDSAGQLREKSLHVKDATASYIQHEPVKSMLMAAAVGAALMGLVAQFSRHHSGHNGR
ncbi:hypothetical protein [Hydrogenophaga taeniospiralis]|uniref:hypothetical protein n=1 Tax=Hydrogenophaga taeniospiralis TaxID=65656 RepID=UPI001CF97C57|nr:hypothetical protein [Hydrogenophaga taeniospiralis]UCU92809.1 hypothetical protein KI616_18535 [Hydrogenophaga taeniospiralis]